MRVQLGAYAGAAIILAAHFGTVGCGDGPADGSGGSGGASGGGPTAGGGAPAGGTGGVPTGGSGGTACDDTNDNDVCDQCEQSVEEYCETADCSLPETLECAGINFTATSYERGCGYVLRTRVGEETSSKAWSEATGELIYYSYTFVPGSGDVCDTGLVGDPSDVSCSSWESACDGYGGQGGAGGEGGAGP